LLQYNAKKVNTALKRLSSAGGGVGGRRTRELTLQERADAVLKSGNALEALSLALQADKKPSYEIVQETVGTVMYLYYLYVDGLHTRPIDIDDMIDGLLYLSARQRIRDNEQ